MHFFECLRFLKEQLYQAVKNNKISQEDIRDKKEYKKIKQALEEMESLYGKIWYTFMICMKIAQIIRK